MIKSAERVTLSSTLPAETCLRKLIQNVDENSWNPFSGTNYVIGDSRGSDFRLWLRRDWISGTYGTYFRGRFVGNSQGTRIEGALHAHPWRKIYAGLWFGFATLLALGASLSLLLSFLLGHQVFHDGPLWLLILAPWIFSGVGFLIFNAVSELEKHDKKRLVEFLQKTLSATRESLT